MDIDPERLDIDAMGGPLLGIEVVRAHFKAAARDFDHPLRRSGRRIYAFHLQPRRRTRGIVVGHPGREIEASSG